MNILFRQPLAPLNFMIALNKALIVRGPRGSLENLPWSDGWKTLWIMLYQEHVLTVKWTTLS